MGEAVAVGCDVADGCGVAVGATVSVGIGVSVGKTVAVGGMVSVGGSLVVGEAVAVGVAEGGMGVLVGWAVGETWATVSAEKQSAPTHSAICEESLSKRGTANRPMPINTPIVATSNIRPSTKLKRLNITNSILYQTTAVTTARPKTHCSPTYSTTESGNGKFNRHFKLC